MSDNKCIYGSKLPIILTLSQIFHMVSILLSLVSLVLFAITLSSLLRIILLGGNLKNYVYVLLELSHLLSDLPLMSVNHL